MSDMETIKGLLQEMSGGVEQFKATHKAEIEALREQLRAIEAKGNRPGAGAGALGLPGSDWSETRSNSGWTDQKGEPVRVLAPGELWAERKAEGIALGDAMRALAIGPRNDFERKALEEGTTTAGGFTVPAPLATWYIDRLRARSVVVQAGARTVPMDSSTMAIARLDSDPAIGWREESAAVAEGDPTFGRVTLQARSIAGIVKVSRELVADTVNAAAMLENAFVRTMALELDRVAIWGSGTAPEPRGIANTVGINEVSMGTNGAQLANYSKLIDAIYELHLDNVTEVTAGILHPRTAASLAKLVDTNGNPLVEPKMTADIARRATTAAPINETQGTSSDCSSIIYGDFRELLIGMREDINIRVLSEAFAGVGQIAFLVHARADVALTHAASFSRLKGIRA